LKRVRDCGRVPVTPGGMVAIKAAATSITEHAPGDGVVAYYSGLASCGSVWACPVCEAKILNARAIEISAAAAAWSAAGNSVTMVTLTMPHDAGMRLSKLLPVVADGFRATIRGRPWIRLKADLRIAGTIRSVEVTHGANGWHPHLHVLVFSEGDIGAVGLAALSLHMRAKWGQFIVRSGYRLPSGSHGVVVTTCHSAAEAGAYVAKIDDSGMAVGNEVARGDLKQGRNGHRTPQEILEAFRWTGDIEDLALWHEYEKATKGHQRITWSKGLRKILAVEDERTDEEIAAEEVGGDVVALLEPGIWWQITEIPGLPAHLLDEAERGGLPAVKATLARHGLQTE
jgi:hypothetical protein